MRDILYSLKLKKPKLGCRQAFYPLCAPPKPPHDPKQFLGPRLRYETLLRIDLRDPLQLLAPGA